MPVDPATIETALKTAFPDADIKVDDLRGDGNYLAAHIIAPVFAGISRIEQHRMVYKVLSDQIAGPLHALALHTKAKDI
jgi:stress-induced morphogen